MLGMLVERTCDYCGAGFSYERKVKRGAFRKSCDNCLGKQSQRYRARNVEKERLRKKRWRDAKRAELGIVVRPRVAGLKDRREIPLSVRWAIIKRDKSTCQYCGRSAPGVPLHVDHVVALAQGGTNAPENLVTACEECNVGKHDFAA
jgi:5-methylcytosine-specific restriction endonuclease McrA